MSLAGVHITFGYDRVGVLRGDATLPCDAASSQNMPSPGTSTISAPPPLGVGVMPILSLSAAIAIFYVTGPSPDINGGPRRYYDPQFGREDIIVNPGDRVAWTTA